jgi:signal transduction histidine kinase
MNTGDVERLHSITGPVDFSPTLHWIVDNLTTEKSVKEINASAMRIAELIGSIKEYSHMDRTKDRQAVDVNHGLQSTLKMLAHKARANKVEVDLALSEELPELSGFPGELNQVWTNLIDNALDAMETTGGILKVETAFCDPRVEITITDTGVGIPEEMKNKIFDPFFTTKSIGKGTGLGLDIANKIILQHKGRVEVESQPGNTRFKLSLPLK